MYLCGAIVSISPIKTNLVLVKTRYEDQTPVVVLMRPEHYLLYSDGGLDRLRVYSISVGTGNTLLK